MFAKQIIVSASLVVAFGGSARAQAPGAQAPTDDEAGPDPGPSPDPLPLAPLPQPAQPAPTPAPPSHPTGRYQLGVGYGVDSGLFASAHVSQANLFGYGYLVSLDAQISAIHDLYALKFVDPHLFDSDFSLTTSVYDDRRILPGFAREAVGTTTTVSHALGDHVRGYFGYRLEHVTGEADPTAIVEHGDPTTVLPPLRSGWISSLRAGVEYSTLDTPIMPLHGTSAGVSVEYADPLLGSDFQITRVSSWLNTHQSLGPFTLHVGGSMSTVDSTDPLGVPLTERLFLDGSSQIRGYAPGALGPVDPLTGVPIGGNLLFTGHVELEVPIARKLGLSVDGFYDAGGIFDHTGAGQIGQSTGFGVIWRSPFGPLHLDLAFPLGGGPPRFVFGIGAMF